MKFQIEWRHFLASCISKQRGEAWTRGATLIIFLLFQSKAVLKGHNTIPTLPICFSKLPHSCTERSLQTGHSTAAPAVSIIWGRTWIQIAYNYLSYPMNLCTAERNSPSYSYPRRVLKALLLYNSGAGDQYRVEEKRLQAFYCRVSTLRIPFCCFYIQPWHGSGRSLATLRTL